MSKSNIKYLHEVKTKQVKDGVVEVHEEFVIDGDKGLTINYYHKDSAGIEKINIKGSGDQFVMKVIVGEQKEEKNLSRAELVKEVGKNKKLSFAKDHVSKAQSRSHSRPKSGSKKGSKKGSRKGSKKGSRKGSKKGSRKSH